jgi:protein TonB
MTKRESLALTSSILVHLGVVFFIGASLISPPKMVNRVEIDLEGARGMESNSGTQAPTPSKAPSVPSATTLPTRSVVPLKISRPQEVVTTPPLPIEPDGSLAAPELPTLPGPPSVSLTRPDVQGASSGSETVSSGKGESGSGRGSALDGYYAAVRRRVDAAKQYPQIAQQRRIQGRVLVSFGLTLDGQLIGEPQLVKSSGYGLLDRAALRAVRRGAPYPEFPGKAEDLPKLLRIEVTFILR